MIPGKHSDTRIKPLPLTSGHGRCTTVARTGTCVRWRMAVTHNRYKFVTVSLPERFRNGSLLKMPCGGFRSETATWIQKHLKKSVGTSRKPWA